MANILKLLLILGLAARICSKQPNIVFILTDDQDRQMESLSYMPKLQSLIGDKGATFDNSFVASPLCCPSRSGILTGQYVHNHGTINNTADGGCGSLDWQDGPEQHAFPLLLNKNGYSTFFAGKYLNTYGLDAVGGLSRIPPGWTSWIGLKGNSVYYNYYLSVNGSTVYHGNDPAKDYLTNVIKDEAVSFIESRDDGKPFFMMLSTPACHEPNDPEPKYRYIHPNATTPRHSNFNIVNVNKNWFVQYGEQPLRPSIVDKIDEIYRRRLRTLATVDDMIESVVQTLDSRGFLEDTYIFYTSDNGFHLGQYSLAFDKNQPYETDIRVPLLVRGPGIEEGVTVKDVTTNIDLAPTFLSLANISIPQNMDGISLTDTLLSNQKSSLSDINERHLLIEHSGQGIEELHKGCEYLGTGLSNCTADYDCKCGDVKNNTYNCVRVLGNLNNELYCIWKDYDFEEYYDVTNDPFEIRNNLIHLYITGRYNYLNMILNNLMGCSGAECNKLT